MHSIVTVERTDAVVCVTMNQPERRNALALAVGLTKAAEGNG